MNNEQQNSKMGYDPWNIRRYDDSVVRQETVDTYAC
jgi:hypothetical protein